MQSVPRAFAVGEVNTAVVISRSFLDAGNQSAELIQYYISERGNRTEISFTPTRLYQSRIPVCYRFPGRNTCIVDDTCDSSARGYAVQGLSKGAWFTPSWRRDEATVRGKVSRPSASQSHHPSNNGLQLRRSDTHTVSGMVMQRDPGRLTGHERAESSIDTSGVVQRFVRDGPIAVTQGHRTTSLASRWSLTGTLERLARPDSSTSVRRGEPVKQVAVSAGYQGIANSQEPTP
jgi:hypothetical protein